jgi:5-methylcytosine-specific restriction endonuclease McrA
VTALSGRGRAWRTLRAQVIAEETVCGICGRWVDKMLTNPHPMSVQVDHIIPIALAPRLTMARPNLRLCHRGCNLRRGTAGAPKRRPSGRTTTKPPYFGPLFTASRKW